MGRGHPWTQRVQVAEVHTGGEEPLLTVGRPGPAGAVLLYHIGWLRAGGPGAGQWGRWGGADSGPTPSPAGPPWAGLCRRCPWARGCPACGQWQGQGCARSALVLRTLGLQRTGLGQGLGVQPSRRHLALGVVASQCHVAVGAGMGRGAWPETWGWCGVQTARLLPAERGGLECSPGPVAATTRWKCLVPNCVPCSWPQSVLVRGSRL